MKEQRSVNEQPGVNGQPGVHEQPGMSESRLMEELNSRQRTARLDALRALVDATDACGIPFSHEVNNHVHTRYSFSPYSPAAVAFFARRAGLRAVGSVDHESIGAASELKEAAAISGIGATVGCELRVGFDTTPFAQRRLNNPDTVGNAYMVLHGVPAGSIPALETRLQPINAAREERNRRQLETLNEIVEPVLGRIEYDREVRPLSWAEHGGSVTERHILYALAHRVYATVDAVEETGSFLADRLGMHVDGAVRERIEDSANPHRHYDLLGVFKAELVPRFFIQPDSTECPPVEEITTFGRELGAIPAYAYLGDVAASPTGDKKAQQFEDEFLEELFALLPALGYRAVTYMPPRNSAAQLERVQTLAARHGLMQISGVDINSSRQSFRCPQVLQPQYRHLVESTWALVGHEVATAQDPYAGLIGERDGVHATTGAPRPVSAARIARFAEIGKRSTPAGEGA